MNWMVRGGEKMKYEKEEEQLRVVNDDILNKKEGQNNE